MATAIHENVNESLCDDPPDKETFIKRRKAHFLKLLERKWECNILGHRVCLPTVAKLHYQLSEEELAVWVEALCRGNATTAQPPANLRIRTSLEAGTNLTFQLPALRAVKTSPSQLRNVKFPVMAASASMRDKLQYVAFSVSSSGVFGVASHSVKALQWLLEKSLNSVDNVAMFMRMYTSIRWLDRWEKEFGSRSPPKNLMMIGKEKEKTLFKILEDALEMSRPCYSARVNSIAAKIGYKMVAWMNLIAASSSDRLTPEMAAWFSHIHSYLSPLRLAPLYEYDPSARQLAWEFLDAITGVPLACQDPDAISANIRILATELAFSPYNPKHRQLGQELGRLVQLVLQFRRLTQEELCVIRDLAYRRLVQNEHEIPELCRPWEIIIFTLCVDLDPWFTNVVRGPRGISSILSALTTLMSRALLGADDWIYASDILQFLYTLSSPSVSTIASTPGIVKLLLRPISEGNIPQSFIYLQDKAVNILRCITSHYPGLLHDIIQLDGVAILTKFCSAGNALPRGSSRSQKRFKNTAIDAARSILTDLKDVKRP